MLSEGRWQNVPVIAVEFTRAWPNLWNRWVASRSQTGKLLRGSSTMIPRPIRQALLAAVAAIAVSHAAWASAEGAAQDEIDHLLNFVSTSSCTFVRTGTEYPADKAGEHL